MRVATVAAISFAFGLIVNVAIGIGIYLIAGSLMMSLVKLGGNGCSETWGIDSFPLVKTDLFCPVNETTQQGG